MPRIIYKILYGRRLRVGAGLKQVDFYRGSILHAEKREILILRPTKQTDVLILRRVMMSVSNRKARSRTIPEFLALELAPPASDTPVLPSGAEAVDVLRPRHSSTSKTVSGSVVRDFCYSGNAFYRNSIK